MSNFVNAMQKENNWKKTENEADALKSTTNSLLDLFGTIGALRTRSDSDIESAFSKAFTEDQLLAMKMGFYARNIRGGLGERRTSRVIWKWLAKVYPDVMRKNLALVSQFGRWDDLYEFVGTELETDAFAVISKQFAEDCLNVSKNKPVSVMAKWLKSTNTSSKESCKLGKLTAKYLSLSEKQYRQILSTLRNQIDVTERKMSANKWAEIKYAGVPSKAMNNYRKAFKKHDQDGFEKYLQSVVKGEAKINSSTLFPYDIMEKVFAREYNQVLEEQWKALPNYVEGENNILIMADVSGSMSMHGIRPLATSVGLAIYFAERNRGAFANVFMTFSSSPDFVKLKGNTLYEKATNARNANWEMNTDIEKAFVKILDVAVSNKIAQDEMPKSLIIISDMEFDAATRSNRKTYYQHMKELYNSNGYELPKVIFWNVDARQNTFHAEMKDGVQFASGQSQSVFKALLNNSNLGAYELMLSVLNDPVYNEIVI
jgi:hypothetical protein